MMVPMDREVPSLPVVQPDDRPVLHPHGIDWYDIPERRRPPLPAQGVFGSIELMGVFFTAPVLSLCV